MWGKKCSNKHTRSVQARSRKVTTTILGWQFLTITRAKVGETFGKAAGTAWPGNEPDHYRPPSAAAAAAHSNTTAAEQQK